MILAIDSTDKIKIGLRAGKFFKFKKIKSRNLQSENLNLEIAKLLQVNKVNLKDLKTIVINRGPGSYTGTRLGVSVANALGFVLNIPVIGLISQKPISIKSLFQKADRIAKKRRKFSPIKPYYRS